MAEETEVVETVQGQVVPQSTNQQEEAPVSKELAELNWAAKLDPSFADTDEYENLYANLTGKGNDGKKVVDKTNANDTQTSTEQEVDGEEESDEEEVENEQTNPFTASKGKNKSKEIQVDFEVPSELNDIVKTKFGIDDVGTFLNSANTWRGQAQKVNEVQERMELIEADLQALPYEIKVGIDAWSKGEDYTKVLQNSTRLNYEVDFSQQDSDLLVQHYLPEEYDELMEKFNKDENFTEDALEEQLKLLSRTTKRFFNEEKQAVKEQRDNYAKEVIAKQKAFKDSALVSVESLQKSYPDFSKTDLNNIRQTLVEGKVDNLLYKSDGSYTDNAAELVAFMLHGKKILEQVENKGVRKGKSEQALEIVDKSPQKIKKSSGGTQNQQVDLSAVKHLTGLQNHDPYA